MITHMQSRNDVEQVEKVKVDDEHLLDYLEGLYSRQDQIEQQLAGLEKDHAAYRPWGKFSREMIQKLETAGWEFHFFSVITSPYHSLNATELYNVGNPFPYITIPTFRWKYPPQIQKSSNDFFNHYCLK